MSRYSYGSQRGYAEGWTAMVEEFFDPHTAEIGDRVGYPNPGDIGDDVWHDACSQLGQRGLHLVDDGSGYVVRASDGDACR
jgi:hypothetical protein